MNAIAREYFKILLTIICSIIIVGTMYLYSEAFNTRNNFKRNIAADTFSSKKDIDIKFNSYYLAGADDDYIYLGNVTSPLSILLVNQSTYDTQSIKITCESKLTTDAIKISVIEKQIYISDYALMKVLKARIEDLKAKDISNTKSYFTDIAASNNNIFVKTLKDNSSEHTIAKIVATKNHPEKHDEILQKQIDGIFCTDGLLKYDIISNKLYYVYFYRNQFISMDTNLNIISRSNTIDTNSVAKIRISEIKSNSSKTLSSPPSIVNKNYSVSGKNIIIKSNLIADNEDKKVFNNNEIFDLYNTENGKYISSFYLQPYLGEKSSDFLIYKNKLFTINSQHLRVYELNQKSLYIKK